MSIPHGIVVVALGYVLAVAGGSDMSGRLPSTGHVVGMIVALVAAYAAASGFGEKFLNSAARDIS